MVNLNIDKVRKFYSIAFKVKNKGSEFGVSKELCEKLIGAEFDIVTPEIILRYFNEMVNAKFILVGINGVKANENIEKEFEEFKKLNN